MHPKRLDLKRGSVDVRESLADVSGTLITLTPKSKKRRSVSLSPFLCDILGEHLELFSSEEIRIHLLRGQASSAIKLVPA